MQTLVIGCGKEAIFLARIVAGVSMYMGECSRILKGCLAENKHAVAKTTADNGMDWRKQELCSRCMVLGEAYYVAKDS